MFMLAAQLLLALVYANAGEWLVHKYVLHGWGKNPQSFWAYHLYGHHAASTRPRMLDAGYAAIDLSAWNAQTKELAVLAGMVLLHLPLLVVWPVFTGGVYGSLLLYYYRHRKAHLDPAWARRHLRWHYEHHCRVCDANWCVTWPWFDYLLGTRVKFPDLD